MEVLCDRDSYPAECDCLVPGEGMAQQRPIDWRAGQSPKGRDEKGNPKPCTNKDINKTHMLQSEIGNLPHFARMPSQSRNDRGRQRKHFNVFRTRTVNPGEDSPAPEKNPYTSPNATIDPTEVTPNIAKINPPLMIIDGTIKFVGPNLSAKRFGATRPTRDAALSMAS
jgi:hypothetical protein